MRGDRLIGAPESVKFLTMVDELLCRITFFQGCLLVKRVAHGFVFPAGYIGANRGMLQTADSESWTLSTSWPADFRYVAGHFCMRQVSVEGRGNGSSRLVFQQGGTGLSA
jgi:hypothetical protein